MIKSIKRFLYPITSKIFLHARLVEGRLKGSGDSFRCLFVDNLDFTKILEARIYEGAPIIHKNWRIFIPSLRKLLVNSDNAFDACVAALPMSYEPLFKNLYTYKSREKVRQIIDISGTWDDVRKRFSKNKHQITNKFPEKFGLGYRISNDINDFDHFYHRMFVPHIKKRYGELAVIESYENMKEYFLKGLLLFVTKNDERLAAALCLVANGVLIFRRTGVLDGNETLVESGAQTALYYYQLKYAHEMGLRAVDAMMSLPFLNDGVYMHKKEWGAAVFPDDEQSTWVYYFSAGSPEKTACFFEKNFVIVESDDGLRGVIGLPNTTDLSKETIDQLIHKYQAKGINGFFVHTKTGVFHIP